jgi:hypothetical protein
VRFSRDQLVFRALVVLDEAVRDCRDAPIQPTLGQRFALMFLFAVSNGERHAYDKFWQAVRGENDHGQTDHMARVMRQTGARTCLTAIARSVGVDFSSDYQRELHVARMPQEDRTAYRLEQARLAEHRRLLNEDGWQYEAEDRAKAERLAAIDTIRAEE